MSLIKLIRKYLLISIVLMLIIGCISHFLIFRYFIHYSSDQMLNEQKIRVQKYVELNDKLPLATTLILKPSRIEERPIDNLQAFKKDVYKDTIMYSEETGTFTPYRQLYFTISYKNKLHLVNINQQTMMPDDLFYAIIASLTILLMILISFTYVIEHLLKKNIWKPLNANLQKLFDYNLKANTALHLENLGIKEFDEINDVILRMVDKINEDYENTRIFTEDASHEMQTPLSIIKSKMDLLIQNQNLMQDEEYGKSIRAISRAVSRLSKLNKSLLLITNINNDQYEEKLDIEFNKQLELYLVDLEELFDAKNLTVKKNITSCTVMVTMNQNLSEILLSNLLSNAIRHNVPNGWIEIYLDQSRLVISNTCNGEKGTANLFNRMTYHHKAEDSSGLGLNIVKSICDKSSFNAKYYYPEDNVFSITIRFAE